MSNFIVEALSSTGIITNAKVGDAAFYAGNTNQAMHIGLGSNTQSVICITNSNVQFNAPMIVGNNLSLSNLTINNIPRINVPNLISNDKISNVVNSVNATFISPTLCNAEITGSSTLSGFIVGGTLSNTNIGTATLTGTFNLSNLHMSMSNAILNGGVLQNGTATGTLTAPSLNLSALKIGGTTVLTSSGTLQNVSFTGTLTNGTFIGTNNVNSMGVIGTLTNNNLITAQDATSTAYYNSAGELLSTLYHPCFKLRTYTSSVSQTVPSTINTIVSIPNIDTSISLNSDSFPLTRQANGSFLNTSGAQILLHIVCTVEVDVFTAGNGLRRLFFQKSDTSKYNQHTVYAAKTNGSILTTQGYISLAANDSITPYVAFNDDSSTGGNYTITSAISNFNVIG